MALQFASDDLRADREVILRATCFKDHFVSATSTFSNTFLGV